MLVYEYIALVRSKAKSIWRRRITAVSILFLWNRYVSLMYGVLGVLEMSTLTPKVIDICCRGPYIRLITRHISIVEVGELLLQSIHR